MRDARTFTIDGRSSRDLDDAVAVARLPGPAPRWRVTVHVADVAHFVKPGTRLDAEARRRATSVYLERRVIPMLPALLGEQLCSLNQGVERLAFTVESEVGEDGEVLKTWVGRTAIKSCCRLDYDTARRPPAR